MITEDTAYEAYSPAPVDARVGAWICSYKTLQALRQHRVQMTADQHQRLLDEASVFCDLACAPETVGIAAGAYIMAEEQEQAQSKERAAEIGRLAADGVSE